MGLGTLDSILSVFSIGLLLILIYLDQKGVRKVDGLCGSNATARQQARNSCGFCVSKEPRTSAPRL